MENKIIAIIGRTASGKDTIAKELEQQLKINKVIGYTTRKKRSSTNQEESSDNHIFIEEGLFKAKELSGSIIGTFSTLAYNDEEVLEEWLYGYSRDIIGLKQGILVTNPISLQKLIKEVGREYFTIIQVNAETKTRRERYMSRDKNMSMKEFDRRSATEIEEFRAVENLVDIQVFNEDGDSTKELAKKIVSVLKSR